MLKRVLWTLLLMAGVAGVARANEDPFVGKWKLNPAKSKLTDVMKVTAAGENKYTFDLGGGPETIVADGTDQAGVYGTTLAVTDLKHNTWQVVRKRDGRTLVTGIWKLSDDGNTLTDNFTGNRPDGTKTSLEYVYKRKSGRDGFAGTWESVSEQVNSTFELEIQPYESDGLSFVNLAQNETTSLKFDGKDYPSVGPNVAPGSVSAALRPNPTTIQMTDKIKNEFISIEEVKVSRDQKLLTMTVHPAGQNKPNVLVFEREEPNGSGGGN